MDRVGACDDNAAAMVSLFSLLHQNMLNRRRETGREELRLRSSPGSKGLPLLTPKDRLGRLRTIDYQTLLQAAHPAWASPPTRVNEILGRPSLKITVFGCGGTAWCLSDQDLDDPTRCPLGGSPTSISRRPCFPERPRTSRESPR
jgi:hypothetical protein